MALDDVNSLGSLKTDEPKIDTKSVAYQRGYKAGQNGLSNSYPEIYEGDKKAIADYKAGYNAGKNKRESPVVSSNGGKKRRYKKQRGGEYYPELTGTVEEAKQKGKEDGEKVRKERKMYGSTEEAILPPPNDGLQEAYKTAFYTARGSPTISRKGGKTRRHHRRSHKKTMKRKHSRRH